jgi:hypothetical protein
LNLLQTSIKAAIALFIEALPFGLALYIQTILTGRV